MQNKLIEIVQDVFGVKEEDVKVIERILGGYSNQLYLVEILGQLFTLRIPGENADLFVNRKEEGYHLALINKLGINSRTAYFNPETGIKISEYIKGTCFAEVDYLNYLEEVTNILKTLHHSDLSEFDYDPMGHIERFEGYLKNFTHPVAYNELKVFMMDVHSSIEYEKVMTHGDCLPANFVYSEDNKLFLLDWEFSGNNDPLYDIACFGDENWVDAEVLLPVYLGRKPTDDELTRLYFWGLFQSLQWFNVAVFKEQSGMSEKLQVDFAAVADFFIEKSTMLRSKIEVLKGS
jgi:thiamine kinase-like enzyme